MKILTVALTVDGLLTLIHFLDDMMGKLDQNQILTTETAAGLLELKTSSPRKQQMLQLLPEISLSHCKKTNKQNPINLWKFDFYSSFLLFKKSVELQISVSL